MIDTPHSELCRLHVLKVLRIDKESIWLAAGSDEAHLPLREAPAVETGESVEVFLYLDQAGKLRATSHHPLVQAGEFGFLTVRSVGPHGAFLDWGLSKDLLAPFPLQIERMQTGKSYLVRVEVDDQGRPYANARISECLDRGIPNLTQGDEVFLIIWQITELGSKVIVNHRYPGLLYRDEIPEQSTIGMGLKGYVKRVRPDGKLDVTLRKVGAEGVSEARKVILRALAGHGGALPLHDGSSAEEIKRVLGMSKKTYKKAVGGLYKDGLVTLSEQGIKMKE